MNQSSCDNLDDYLADELDARRRTEFEAHLEVCPACREELLAQAELARLLRAATEMLETSPAELTASITRGVATAASRRRRLIAVAAMVAAVVVCAASWSLQAARDRRALARPQPGPRIAKQRDWEQQQIGADTVDESGHEGEPEVANMADAAVAAAAVRVASTSESIAVSIKSENPSVTIFWLYPTVTTAR
jgi:anti-sigma factor RsiW